MIILPAYKDKIKNTWYAKIRYTDWTGKIRETTKRGFARKKDALLYEEKFKRECVYSSGITFGELYDIYMADITIRLRISTCYGRDKIFKNHILPYFKDLKCNEITPAKIRKWQNTLISKNKYAPSYLRYMNNQLTIIFNFAVKYCNLDKNPMKKVDTMGTGKPNRPINIWSTKDFNKFIANVDSLFYKIIFSVLFWTGMRVGEVLALTLNDFNFKEHRVHVSKTYTKLKGKDIIGPPKTEGSNRDISLPNFIIDEIKIFVDDVYGIAPNDRLFEISTTGLRQVFNNTIEKAKLKRIRIHDLRHSHASYLIEKNIPIIAISKRLGHDRIETTLKTYAHLYPKKRDIIIDIIENDNNKKCGQSVVK